VLDEVQNVPEVFAWCGRGSGRACPAWREFVAAL
jgi:hypothetical protein